jgi:hypothetical protein
MVHEMAREACRKRKYSGESSRLVRYSSKSIIELVRRREELLLGEIAMCVSEGGRRVVNGTRSVC